MTSKEAPPTSQLLKYIFISQKAFAGASDAAREAVEEFAEEEECLLIPSPSRRAPPNTNTIILFDRIKIGCFHENASF
ncbi:hypothetical protein EVAR_69706_1 [Eumeta japonica]|uniref:Uncharacterized protein n=1 Tax=Eumeta variegata TaxID=151549 RepID=A0A4C1SX63_EUMVA|nr:hypothetical protein EVAR_69706_1 [Eumeta japonica]